ncbi:MAG: TetR/AcrR family transcriptional regulator [Paludibacter sp.]|nr:TetR/AcrR family transcriptional regulator [Paludibacter sp.]MDD4198659.1 TetR/AcrR family transcriptional regulator [Paludibacter sp.]MDD4427766.1 TetR/AcrR family transcriptional regulator [Paludibacter sp.]
MTKKQKIEQIAKELFLKYGFKKVTVDEICKKAHVSRKTYYTLYENKNALVLYVLKEIVSNSIQEYKKIIDSQGSFADKMKRSLELKYAFSKTLTMEFVADIVDPGSVEILEYWKIVIQESMVLLTNFLREGQRTGEMNPELNLNYVLWIFGKMSDILNAPEALLMFGNAEEMVRQVTQMLVYGIMPVPIAKDKS